MKVLDAKYTFVEVSRAYNISRSSLRDDYLGKKRSRKMGAKGTLTKEEDDAVYKYILDMAEVGLLFTPTQVQQKAGGLTHERPTSFKDGMLGRSWLKWFLHKHLEISFRSLQILD